MYQYIYHSLMLQIFLRSRILYEMYYVKK